MQKKKVSLEKLLSLAQHVRYEALEDELSYLEAGTPFYAVIGVEDEELGESFLQEMEEKIPSHQVLTDIPFDANYLSYFQQLTPETCYLIPAFQLSLDPAVIARNMLFNRDVIPEKQLQLIWILNQPQYDAVLQTAYDFISGANFADYFQNDDAQTRKHFLPRETDTEVARAYLQAKTESEAENQPSLRKTFAYALAAQNYLQYDEAVRLYEKALNLDPEDDYRAAIIGNLGLIFQDKGDWEKALQYQKESLELHRKLGNIAGEARQLGNLGNIYYSQGDWEKALQYQKESLELERKLGNIAGEASTLGNLGLIFRNQGDWEKALQYQKESLELHRKLGNIAGEASTLGNLGLIFQDKGDWEKALQYQKESLELHRKLGNIAGEARQLGNLGLIFQDKGDWEKALQYQKESLELERKLGNIAGEARQLGNLGNIYYSQGDWEKALQYQKESLELERKLGNIAGEARQLGNLGNIYYSQGDWEKALQYMQEGLIIAEKIGYKQAAEVIARNIQDLKEKMTETQRLKDAKD